MEINPNIEKLANRISKIFDENDFPCLSDQYDEFLKTRPLENMKILHATPVFTNTLAKLLPLLASGAKLTVTSPQFVAPSSVALELLREMEINFVNEADRTEEYDLILDCAGSMIDIKSKYGAVELTKSGEQKYLKSGSRFINVDDSDCKKIEDEFGTADGFIRALIEMGYTDFKKTFLIIGYGKVGQGIAKKLDELNSTYFIIDPIYKDHPRHLNLTNFSKTQFDFVVTATGVVNVASNYLNYISSDATLINMGAEDEYGENFQASRVLNNKKPFNFILKEPTKLKYLDPVFALHNKSLIGLIGSKSIGLIKTPSEYDEYYKRIYYERS